MNECGNGLGKLVVFWGDSVASVVGGEPKRYFIIVDGDSGVVVGFFGQLCNGVSKSHRLHKTRQAMGQV